VPQKARRSPEEHQCEEHFRTHSHTPEGRYIVRLLFKNGLSISIGKSRSIVSSFRRLEQRLSRDPITAFEYHEFLAEYETFSYMTKNPNPTEIINQSKLIIFRITLSYVTAVQPSAYK